MLRRRKQDPKAAARAALEADLMAEDITYDEYSRELSRIEAGSPRPRYLRAHGDDSRPLTERVMAGDHRAITRVVKWGVAIFALILVLGAVGSILSTETDDDDGDDSPPIVQQQPSFDTDEDDDFEGDDD
jgi:hypothetical protein